MTEEHERTGNCFESAANFVVDQCMFDRQDCIYILVHGEVQGQGHLKGVTFGHAWVEFQGPGGSRVHDPEQGMWDMPRDLYYALAGIDHRPAHQNVYRYTAMETFAQMRDNEHYGPWDLVTATGL